ncbi:MAG: hypothetical protein ABL903_19070, partial [Methylococcales bacterium]
LTPSVFAVLLLGSGLAMAEADYPAADFQPKVLFTDDTANDAALKNKPKASTGAAVTQNVVATKNTTPDLTTSNKGSESDSTSLLGLLALAAVGGFLFYKKQGGLSFGSATKASASNYVYGRDSSGLSGVTRYLKNRELLSASGVTRYLAQQEATAKAKIESTGVAKYVKAQTGAASNDGSGATGVEKYLKNRA